MWDLNPCTYVRGQGRGVDQDWGERVAGDCAFHLLHMGVGSGSIRAAPLHLVLRGLNAKRVGHLLRRAEGQAVDGYGVQRQGFELHAVLWRVRRS
jgi:hypothetical protein